LIARLKFKEFALTVAPHTDLVAHITVTVIGETVQG